MQEFKFMETGYRTIIASLVIFLVSLLMIVSGNEVANKNVIWYGINVGAALSNLGSLVGIIALMQFIYDSSIRKKFFEEIVSAVSSTRSILDMGILAAYKSSKDADFSEEVKSSKTLCIVYAHSKRFVDRYESEISSRCKSGKLTEVFMNHPESAAVRYYVACGRDETYVKASIGEFQKVLKKLDNGTGMIKVYLIDVVPKGAMVLLDRVGLYTMSTSSEGQTTVPMLTIRKDSPMWDFLNQDIQTIRQTHLRAEPQ